MSKITDYTVLTGAVSSDILVIVDVSDTTQSAQGTTKQVTLGNAAAGFSPMTTLGDLTYENSTPAPARLAGNTSSTKNYLTQTGTGSVSAAPAWGTIAAADLPAATTSTQGAVILDGTATDIQPTGVRAAGSVGKAADAGHVHATPATTAGDLVIMNATPAPARLAIGTANQVLGISSSLPAWQPAFTLQTQTASAGFTLANSTGTIITWTTPNDGAIHHLLACAYVFATSTETGGQINIAFTDLASNAVSGVNFISAGVTTGNASWDSIQIPVKANTTVTISQGTALTAGAAKCWAEIWGC